MAQIALVFDHHIRAENLHRAHPRAEDYAMPPTFNRTKVLVLPHSIYQLKIVNLKN